MVTDICKPFGINVIDAAEDKTTFKDVTIQSGESCFSVIDRFCKQVGVLPITFETGELVLANAAEVNQDPVADLVLGENILSLLEVESSKERFSEYTIKGQKSGEGKPWKSEKATTLMAKSTDKGVERYRPLVIMSEGKTTPSLIQKRANWEAQVRAGRSKVFTTKLRGWLQVPGGSNRPLVPWMVNTLVNLRADSYDFLGQRVITSVTFTLDTDAGRITTLVLKDPTTYRKSPGEAI